MQKIKDLLQIMSLKLDIGGYDAAHKLTLLNIH